MLNTRAYFFCKAFFCKINVKILFSSTVCNIFLANKFIFCCNQSTNLIFLSIGKLFAYTDILLGGELNQFIIKSPCKPKLDRTGKDNQMQIGVKINAEKIPENLILRLKYVCDKIGNKYVESNPQISAKIFHQIGKHFQLTCRQQLNPDKILLIQCAGLLNSALARNPDNVDEILQDLRDLCKNILKLSPAKNKDADLVGHAEIVKKQIDQMRNRVNKRLDEITKENQENSQELPTFNEHQKIKRIQTIQQKLTEKFKDIMEELSDYCENVMGDPPCDYALVGMGSLARQEITPYSDFENMILLKDGCKSRKEDYHKILEYFRWFAVIFQIVLINLQETIIPSLAIPGLNDSSTPEGDWFFDTFTSGISFDGFMATACKMPLGNLHHNLTKEESFELIRPVTEMVEYTKRPTKTGNYLKQILLENCFVSGSQKVYEDYVKLSKQNQTNDVATLKNQVEVDLNSFGARQKLSDIDALNRDNRLKLNVKRIIYRSSTLFISALGLYHNISAASCFGVISELFISKKINADVFHKLSFAVAIACEARLRVYMKKESQQDNIRDEELIKMLVEMFGESNILKYFQATYTLQCHICKILNIHNAFFYTKPYLFNITISWFFGFEKRCFALIQNLENICELTVNYNCIEECLSQLENEIVETNNVYNDNRESFNTNFNKERLIYFIENVGGFFFATGIYEVCIEYYNRYLTFFNTDKKKMSHNAETACRILGLSWMNLKMFDKALAYFEESLRIFQLKKSIALVCSVVGEYFIERVDNSEKNVISEITSCGNYLLQEAQELQNQSEKKTYVSVLYNIAVCLYEKERYLESVEYLEQALIENEILDENSYITLAMHNYLVVNFVSLKKYREAFEHLEKSNDFKMISVVIDILRCRNELVIAMSCLSSLLNHSKENCFSERELLKFEIDHAYCKVKAGNGEINDLEQVEKKLRSLSTDIESDVLAQRLFLILGAWHGESNQNFDSALSYFDEAIRIGENIISNCKVKFGTNSANDLVLARLNSIICEKTRGNCHIMQKNYDLAISRFNKALKLIHLLQNLDLPDDNAENNASDSIPTELDQSKQCLRKVFQALDKTTLGHSVTIVRKIVFVLLGFCQMKKSNFQIALIWFYKFCSIPLFQSVDTEDKDVMFKVLFRIGRCWLEKNDFDKALSSYEKALKFQRTMQASYERCAKLFYSISLCLFETNRFHEAFQAIVLALSCYTQMGPKNEFLLNECLIGQSKCVEKLDEQIRKNMPF